MKNNKGFTLIELGISIILVSAISYVIFQIVVSTQKMSQNGNLKTILLTKQATITKKIQDDLTNNFPASIGYCANTSNSCLTFYFSDGSFKHLLVNPLFKTITYGDYTINYNEIDKSTNFGSLIFFSNNDLLYIKIPISIKNIDDSYSDYSIIISKVSNKQFYLGSINTNNIVITNNNNYYSIPIINDGNDYYMQIYSSGATSQDTWLNNTMKEYIDNLVNVECENLNEESPVAQLKNEEDTNRYINLCEYNDYSIRNIYNNSNEKNTYAKINHFYEKYTFKDRTNS